MTTTTLACNFPGCLAKDLKPETALVPAIKAIKQAEGGRPVTSVALAKHVFCKEHGSLGRGNTGGMFSYLKTVEQLDRYAAKRMQERTTANEFFAKYSTPASTAPAPGKPRSRRPPSTGNGAMQLALRRSGLVEPETPEEGDGAPAAAKAASA